jgi:cytochrome c-type biogenesis protein CcmF
MTTLGQILLAASTLASLVSIALLALGHLGGPKDGEPLTNAGYIATFVAFLTTSAAILLLWVAFFTKNFSFIYVVENHSRDVSNLRWFYDISAVWAGREGSLLFWEWILSSFAAFVAWRRLSVTDAVSNIGLAIINFVQVFFLVVLFFPTNNPFHATPAEAFSNGQLVGSYALQGMNPLLQHWAMILHPPTLFIGYAGLTVPFAFALAALFIRDESDLWIRISDRITVFSWLMLSIGIGLGAIWAYVVLGWGGYWGWDPVENASLLPWLTGVGLLHSFTAYRRRGSFKRWAIMMSSITFLFVLLGTFITRSGVIESVHSFGQDPLSFWAFLLMMAASVLIPAAMLLMRPDAFRGKDDFTSLMSKDGSYYFNNVFMLFAAVLVAGLTLSPAFGGPSFNAASYDLLARPVGIIYVLLMTICPILSWGSTDRATFWKRAKWPLTIGSVLSVGLLAIWAMVLLPNYSGSLTKLPALAAIQAPLDHIEGIIGLIVAAFAIALPLYLFYDGARKRAAARGENPVVSFFHILFKSRTQSGGYLTHLGVGIVLIGLVGSSMYVKDMPITLQDKEGASAKIGSYEIVYRGYDSKTLSNGDLVNTVKIDVSNNGKFVTQMKPAVTQLANRSENQSTKFAASVYSQVLSDFFVSFKGGDDTGLFFDVKINPLISWAWAGFFLMLIGTGIAMWPRKELAVAEAPKPAPRGKKKAA